MWFKSNKISLQEKRAAVSKGSEAKQKNKPLGDDMRFPKGFKKQGRLGTGGFGVVWEGISKDGVVVAVKQVIKGRLGGGSDQKNNPIPYLIGQTSEKARALRPAKNEIAVAKILFPNSQNPDEAGSKYIVRLRGIIETTADLWLIFDKGGATLCKALYKMKGDFVKVIAHTLAKSHARRYL